MSSLDRIKKKRQQLLVENNKSYSSTDKSIERIKLLRNELSTTGKIDYGDIAPIKFDNSSTKEKDKKDTWFNSGAFGDGYDFGDITKTLLGTVGDVGLGVVKGVGNLAEGVVDLGTYAVGGVADILGADKFADKTKEFAQKSYMDKWIDPLDEKVSKNSLLGEKADAISEGLGYVGGMILTGGLGAAAGLGAVGTTALTTATTFASSMGGGIGQAYTTMDQQVDDLKMQMYSVSDPQEKAKIQQQIDAIETDADGNAVKYGIISGIAEAGTELIFGGLGKTVKAVGLSHGLSQADDILAKTLTKKIENQVIKNFAEFGIKAGAEGTEEVLSGVIQAFGQKATYMSEEELGKLIEDQNLLESFVTGAIVSGIAQAPSLSKANTSGRDFVTNYTQNEQSVIDKEVENRIAEQEKDGKKLNKKQINEITEQVQNELEKGYISTDTIESVLGGDTYNSLKSTRDNKTKIENEIKELEGKKNAEITVKEMEHLKDLREQLKGIDTNTLETDLQGKMGQIIKSDGYLQRSYQEKAKRGQKFTYDASKVTNEFEKAALESASKVMNDTNRSHEFVEPVVKLAKDKGTYYEFTNNKELEKSNYDVKGKQVNGLVTVEENGKKKILINVDSSKALNTIVGHETTHLLEGTQEYQELQDAIFNYAKTKGDFDSRQASLYSLYKGIKGADVNSELTADLVGDYLFTDNNFISELSTQKPTVFQKIKELIDDLVVRFKGTKEEKALREVQKKFKEAYRQQTGQQTGTQYSLSDSKVSKQYLEKQFQELTGVSIKRADAILGGIELRNTMRQDGNRTDAIETIPYSDEAMEIYKAYKNSRKSSNALYHTTSYENLQSVLENGLTTNNKARQEGVSGTGKLYLAADEQLASSFGEDSDILFRIDPKYNLDNLDSDLLGGEGTYSTTDNIPVSALQVKENGKWVKLEKSQLAKYSLSNPNEIAPRNPNLTYGEDVKLQVEETIAPLQEEIQTLTETVQELKEQLAPINKTNNTFENALNESIYYRNTEKNLKTLRKYNEDFSKYYVLKDGSIVALDKNGINYSVISDNKFMLDGHKIGTITDNNINIKTDNYSLDRTTLSLNDFKNINQLENDYALVTKENTKLLPERINEYAPLTEEDLPYLEQQYNEAPKENIAPPEIEENIPVAEDEITPTKSLFETRNYEEVGSRKVNAYQYDNPEVKPYFQEAARSMIDDLAYSLKGQRIYNDQVYYDTNGEQGFFGINRFTSNDIAELLDGVDGKYKLSYKDLEKGLKAIIEDKGAENNAASKRIEFYLDKRLREGFKTLDGVEIPANQEYLKLLEAIETTDYHNSIPIGEAPVENVDIPVGNVSNTKVSEEIAPIKEQETQQPDEENKNLTIKESNALKLNNLEQSLQKYGQDAEQSLKAYDDLIEGTRKKYDSDAQQMVESYNNSIEAKRTEYNSLKNKNTQKANNLLQQMTRIETQREKVLNQYKKKRDNEINRLTTQRNNIQVEYERKMNNIQKRIDKMNSKEFKTAEQRITKQQEYRQQARELIGDTSTWKDKKMGISYQIHTFKRNLRDIVRGVDGKTDLLKADAIYEEYEGKYDKNEAKLKVEYNRIMNPYAELDLTEQEHVYTQMLGEFKYNPDTTLTKEQVDGYYNKHKSKIDVDKVNNAIESARKTYDELFDRINERLREQGMKELEYRRGYFPHFVEEKQGLLAKIFDWKIHKDDIPTDIAGLTELNNPERSWQSFNKHRESDITDYNFGKGLETYVRGALDWIYHIEDIQKRRALENEIRYQHSEKGIQEQIEEIYTDTELDTDQIQERIDSIYKTAQNPLNNFVTDFRNATNRLANKKSTMDRSLEYATNRRIYSTMTNLSNRTSGNMIVGSISSALTNFIPITQSWGEVNPLSSLQAARETIKNATIDDGTIAKSTFLTNRLVKNEKLYKTGWDKVQDKVAIMTDVIDSFTSQTVWRSKYNENIKNGMSEMEAIANADNFAKNVIAGRSRGNEPTIFHSKNPLIKMFTTFQTEISNQYDYMFKDMPTDVGNQSKAKLIKGYAMMFIGANIYNALYSSLTGRDAAFDPIGIVEDILKELGFGDDEEEEEKTASEKFTAITEDLVQQLPFVGGLFGGGRVPISAAIPYENPIEMVKGTSTDLLDALDEEKRERALKDLTTEWLKPVTYLALPFGGGQINKTIQGLSMYDDDLPVAGSYTNSGDLRFTADESIGGMFKSALFGRWASDSAQEYVDSGFKTVKKSNIDEMVDLDMSSTEYRKYRNGLNKAGKTTDEKGNAKYIDDDGDVYWYDKKSKTLYDSDYEESNLSVLDLEKASKSEQIYEYITGLDVSDEQKEIMFNNAIDTTTTDKYGYTKYVDDSNKTYWYDEETDTLYNSSYKKVDNDLLFDLTEYSGKDLSNYDNFGNYEEFDYATKNPDKYRVIEQIDTFDNYNSYKTEIENIKERYSTDEELTSKQKTALSKQRKAAVQQYINSLSLDIPQKIMLEKMAGGYSIKDYENYMFGYIESLPMTAEEKQAIHKQLFD